MPDHQYGEPWRDHGELKTAGIMWHSAPCIRTADSLPVAASVDNRVRQRILACVNACSNLSDEQLQNAPPIANQLQWAAQAHSLIQQLLHCQIPNSLRSIAEELAEFYPDTPANP